MDIVAYYETYIYAAVYFSMLAIMALWESCYPLRKHTYPLTHRWFSNFMLGTLTILTERAIFPLLGFGVALYCQQKYLGLFNLIDVPQPMAVLISILFLDFAAYLIHRAMHHIPFFWSFHKVHHSDPDYDFTTSFRFHPLDGLVTTAVSLGAILIIGAPVLSVILIQICAVCVNFFAHGNIPLLPKVEKFIRVFCVTPDMHRIHHSAHMPRTNSNYGIIFPYWDYLGQSFTPSGSVDQKSMPLGLGECQGKKYTHLIWLLSLPFRGRDKQSVER